MAGQNEICFPSVAWRIVLSQVGNVSPGLFSLESVFLLIPKINSPLLSVYSSVFAYKNLFCSGSSCLFILGPVSVFQDAHWYRQEKVNFSYATSWLIHAFSPPKNLSSFREEICHQKWKPVHWARCLTSHCSPRWNQGSFRAVQQLGHLSLHGEC